MIKKYAAISLLILVILSLTGCAGQTEIDELGIVNLTAVSIDSKTGKYELIVQVVSPRKTGQQMVGTPQVWTVTATGETLMKAGKNLRAKFSKQLVWYHSNIIIIEEKVARKGLKDIIDFFASNQEMRYNSWFLVAKQEIEKIIKVSPRFENSLARELEGEIENYEEWSNTYALNLKDMLIRLSNPQYDELTGRITTYQPRHSPEGKYEQKDLVKGLSADDKRVIALDGTAVFKDGKLQGWFDRVETRGYLWITGEMKQGVIVVPVKVGKQDSKNMSVEILNGKSELKTIIEENKIRFKLDVKTRVQITEKASGFNLTDPENINKAEQLIASKIKDEIKAALKKAQEEYNADVFGFSDEVYRNYPERWKQVKEDWDRIFPTINLTAEIDVKIKRLGMTSKQVME